MAKLTDVRSTWPLLKGELTEARYRKGGLATEEDARGIFAVSMGRLVAMDWEDSGEEAGPGAAESQSWSGDDWGQCGAGQSTDGILQRRGPGEKDMHCRGQVVPLSLAYGCHLRVRGNPDAAPRRRSALFEELKVLILGGA